MFGADQVIQVDFVDLGDPDQNFEVGKGFSAFLFGDGFVGITESLSKLKLCHPVFHPQIGKIPRDDAFDRTVDLHWAFFLRQAENSIKTPKNQTAFHFLYRE